MSQLTFYTNPYSRGRTVQWMLNECGASYDTKFIEYEDIKSPDYLAINPMGKVPALVVHQKSAHLETKSDIVITEVVAICAYLADAYPDVHLAPAVDSPQRGIYYRWLFWACNVLEPALMTEFGLMRRTESAEAKRALGFGNFREALAVLEKELNNRQYLCDDKFSAADLYMVAMLNWAVMQGAVKALPETLAEYVNGISKREALVKIG